MNGQVQEFKDEATNETQYPITYNGRTYLPLRTVANLFDIHVDYDAKNNKALLFSNNVYTDEQLLKNAKEYVELETGEAPEYSGFVEFSKSDDGSDDNMVVVEVVMKGDSANSNVYKFKVDRYTAKGTNYPDNSGYVDLSFENIARMQADEQLLKNAKEYVRLKTGLVPAYAKLGHGLEYNNYDNSFQHTTSIQVVMESDGPDADFYSFEVNSYNFKGTNITNFNGEYVDLSSENIVRMQNANQ